MKAVLVIEMSEDYMGSNIEVKLYGKTQTVHERYVNKLRPLPQKKPKDNSNELNLGYELGWNACLDEITGNKMKAFLTIDMPTECVECSLCDPKDVICVPMRRYVDDFENGIPDWCPLVLVDWEDALREKLKNMEGENNG